MIKKPAKKSSTVDKHHHSHGSAHHSHQETSPLLTGSSTDATTDDGVNVSAAQAIQSSSYQENSNVDTFYHANTPGEMHYWKELLSFSSSLVLLIMSYSILLYLLSYTQAECPPSSS